MPIIATRFERITLDFVGPLPMLARGHWYLLLIMDYAMKCPEAITLRGMQVQGVAQALVCFFSRVGRPREILTDRGATFTSTLMKQLGHTVGIC